MANWRTDLFQQSGTGAVARSEQDKLRDVKHAYDIGCACDGSTDDYALINAYILGEVTAGRTPWLEFPPGTTTMVSQALPFRNNVGYICRGGWATIKAHSTSTDNVMGEGSPVAAYTNVTVDGIIIDGNRAAVSYNTRNGGLTDDAFQNGIRLNQVSRSYFNIRVQESVMNGISVYNASNDNVFVTPRCTDIGKSTSIAGGAASYHGIFVEFGCSRNRFIDPHVGTTKEHGIWETAPGADNYDNEYLNPFITTATGDGIKIGDDSGTSAIHRPKIISPTIVSCTGVGLRLQPNAGGAINDPLVVAPHISSCAHGLLTNNVVNRLRIVAPSVLSNTNNGINIAASAVDTVIEGGQSLSNGTNYGDSGTRTVRLGLVSGTIGGSLSGLNWGTALVALGGGAAPTLGTIGGSGPTAAGQNSWMQIVDSTGATFWVPAWK